MKVLIKNRNHQRPMHAILERYGIGDVDNLGRGRWIYDRRDLPKIREAFEKDGHHYGDQLFLEGTCRHNHVFLEDFERLLRGGGEDV